MSKENETPKETVISKRDLPRDRDIIGVLGSLKTDQQNFVKLMAITGRRAIDLLRLRWNLINISGNRVCAVLPKDKTHRNALVSFTFEFNEYDLALGKRDFVAWLKKGVKTNSKKLVFENFKKQQVTTKCRTFKLHSLRNRKAISMLVNGKSPEQVQDKIGWASLHSLLRYTKLSVEFIQSFNSYNEVVEFLFKLRKAV